MNKLYSKVYGWLFVGLMLTFATGAFLANYENAIINLMSGLGYVIVVIVELGLALFLSARIQRMSNSTAIFCYLLYSFVTGISFSTIFMAFNMKSLILIFLVTAIVFGLCALLSSLVKLPLERLGYILFMMLLGIIIATLLNAFIGSSTIDSVICVIAIIVFIGYIGYDIKKLSVLFNSLGEEKGAIYGAFQLYLDFINIFIYLLQIVGGNDNN